MDRAQGRMNEWYGKRHICEFLFVLLLISTFAFQRIPQLLVNGLERATYVSLHTTLYQCRGVQLFCGLATRRGAVAVVPILRSPQE